MEYWLEKEGVKVILRDLPSPVKVAIIKAELLRKARDLATAPPKALPLAQH
jgi:ribosomal protein S12 methylthiotransferase accessory factor YcaO